MITVRLKECTTANIRKGGMIMLRVGMLTSGGDCQALNAAMRGVAKSLFNQCSEVEIYGFTDGYKGLIYGEYRLLKNDDFSGILNIGGTILGSSRMPFKYIGVPVDEIGYNQPAGVRYPTENPWG